MIYYSVTKDESLYRLRKMKMKRGKESSRSKRKRSRRNSTSTFLFHILLITAVLLTFGFGVKIYDKLSRLSQKISDRARPYRSIDPSDSQGV